MKNLVIFLLIVCSRHTNPVGQPSSFIDPTGTYILKGEVEKKEIKGHFGELRVKLLNPSLAAICFYMNTGYPDYTAGSFLDTLFYDEDHFQYKPLASSDCFLYFYFHPLSAELQQSYSDPHSNCGFAKGVIISTSFKKYSDEKPVIQDLSNHGVIP